jgi:leader peptidase (prepilin peptidase) / N-methyltransferase
MNGLSPLFLIGLGICFGAVAGSFLNVLIHRIPRLIDAGDGRVFFTRYLSGLSWPPSHCPCCEHRLYRRDYVPILSYLALGGRCRFCHHAYGLRYLAVEVLAAVTFAACLLVFGLTAKAFLAAIIIAGLLALCIIDIQEQLLPDALVAPLFCLGLAFHAWYGSGLADAALGAGAGYGVLWLIREAYRLYAGIEGMGYGDVKLAAALGAWLGLAAMPAMLFIAFASGVAVMLPVALCGRVEERAPVPFGPFLALGGVCVFALPKLAELTARLFIPA